MISIRMKGAKFIILLIFLILSNVVHSQKKAVYTLSNEQVVFSFQTKNGKIMSLNIDTNFNYIVYRFGTKNKIELEYPEEKDKNSFEKFEYSHYFRPRQNGIDGMNLNYVKFTNENVRYEIYQNRFEYINSKTENFIGIKVEEIEKEKTIDIKGINRTKKGSIGYFLGKNLLKSSNEFYD